MAISINKYQNESQIVHVIMTKFEIENLRNMLMLFNQYPDMFPLINGGDWIKHLINKISENVPVSRLNNIDVPTFGKNYKELNIGDQIEKITVEVGEILQDNALNFFQRITYYYYFQGENFMLAGQKFFLHSLKDFEFYLISKESRALNVGVFDFNDYLVMRSLKDENFLQNDAE